MSQEIKEDKYSEYLSSLRDYYNLKNKYEKTKESYKNTLLKSNVSRESKKKLLSKQKFKCINCKKDGGTIFLETSEGFKATCGNISSPCDLNIDLKKINTINLIDEFDKNERDLEESKRKITLTKLDYLFKYIEEDSAVEQFEELKTELNQNQEKYNKILEYYYNITDNQTKNELFTQKNIEFFQLLSKYKELIKLFKDSEDTVYLKEAVSLYIDKIMPINKNILDLKYKINLVESVNECNFLIQKKININDYDINV